MSVTNIPQGLLIALEGIDGAGTSTQMPHVAAYLSRQGLSVYPTAQPSKRAIGYLLRQGLQGAQTLGEATLALLFAADRLDHLEHEIMPQLALGKVVLTDRYLLSSYAYQGSVLPQAWLQEINNQARLPDLSIFFRVSPHTAKQRRLLRGGGHELFDDDLRQTQVAKRYEAALALPNIGRVYVIDAEPSAEQVTLALEQVLRTYLTERAA